MPSAELIMKLKTIIDNYGNCKLDGAGVQCGWQTGGRLTRDHKITTYVHKFQFVELIPKCYVLLLKCFWKFSKYFSKYLFLFNLAQGARPCCCWTAPLTN